MQFHLTKAGDYLYSLCRARTMQTRDQERREKLPCAAAAAAEDSSSLRSGSTAGASVVTNSNSVGHTSSMHPLPLPEPLDSSPGGGGLTRKVRALAGGVETNNGTVRVARCGRNTPSTGCSSVHRFVLHGQVKQARNSVERRYSLVPTQGKLAMVAPQPGSAPGSS